MKKVVMLSALGLMLAACGNNDQMVDEDPTVESPGTTDEGATDGTDTTDDTTDDTADDTTGDTTDDAQNLINVSLEFDIDDDIYDVNEDAWEQRVETEEGTTLLELMQEHYEIEEDGGFITSIEGYAEDADRNAHWIFEVNDQQSSESAADYVLQDGDEIEWELDDN